MAVRQQQRRGTAAQWTAANPILSAAEIGFEIDTNKFKIGDGINRWADLVYFTADAAAALNELIDGAPDLLNTLNELAAAVGDDANFFSTVTTNIATAKSEAISTASSDATTKANAAQAAAAADATSKVTAEATARNTAITTAKSDAIATAASDATSKVAAEATARNTAIATAISTEVTNRNSAITTAVAGVVGAAPAALDTLKELADALTADESTAASLATLVGTKAPVNNPTFTGTVAGITKSMVGLANVDNTSDASKPVSTATQAALDLKANSADITELSQDAVNSALTAGSGITKTYNDSANTITVAVDSTIATKTYADSKASDAQTAASADATSKVAAEATARNTAIATAKSEAISTASSDATTKANNAKSGAETTAANALASHEADTTNIHGIADTSALATKTYADNAASTAVAAVVNSAPEALNTLKELADALTADESAAATLSTLVGTKAPIASPTFTGTVSGITKAMVGLSSVDNTADTAKPVSTSQATAIATAKSEAITAAGTATDTKVSTHNTTTTNVHGIADTSALATKTYADGAVSTAVAALTKSSVGLGNVNNTTDAAKPVSTATQTALDLKANLASPTLTGTPTAPTASYSVDTTQIATTAFVKSVLNNIGSLNLVLDGGGVN
jgi:hypothetical protein